MKERERRRISRPSLLPRPRISDWMEGFVSAQILLLQSRSDVIGGEGEREGGTVGGWGEEIAFG